MKRIFVGTCILAACAFAVAAGTTQSAGAATQSQGVLQEPTEPPQQPEPPPTEPAPPTDPAPAEPTEPSPTEPSPAEPGAPMGEEVSLQGCLQEGDEAGTFKLTDAKPAEDAGAPADAGAGAPEIPAGDITVKAAAGVDLSEHVGHTITVSGGWAEGLEPGAPSGVAEAGATGGGKALEAQSVEMVSASCEGGF
ncbi:MAG: hypothetical protein GEV06_24765 [Luteitalea sp.]|nr:hypothetical protein [Luteitalea sp.]